MRPRLALALALVTALAVALPAAAQDQSPVPAGPPTSVVRSVSCDALAAGGTIALAATVEPGTALILEACSDPATGFRWSDPVVADPAVASVVGWVYRAPGDDAVGAPGIERFLLDPLGAGTTSLSAAYARPWETPGPGAPRIELALTVTAAESAPVASPGVPREAAGQRLELGLIRVVLPEGTRVRFLNPWTELEGIEVPFVQARSAAEDLRIWVRLEIILPEGTSHAFLIRPEDGGATIWAVDESPVPIWNVWILRTTDSESRPVGSRTMRMEGTMSLTTLIIEIR